MAVLDVKAQQTIDETIDLANEHWESDRALYYLKMLEAWGLYPEPKNNWNEAYSLAKEIFDAYLIDKNTDEAKKWLSEMIAQNNNLHLMDFDLSFNIGKYHFETGDFEKAKEEWDLLVKQTGFRYFGSEDTMYLEFYKNHK